MIIHTTIEAMPALRRVLTTGGILLAALVAFAADADAQWHFAAYLGGSHTRPANVTIERPGEGVAIVFEDVSFEERSLKSPQYYGLRFGRWFGRERRLGVEIEWMHPKAYAITDRRYDVSGDLGPYGDRIQPPAPMNALVSRYAMSHGMNFLFANVAYRTAIGDGPITAVVRGGAGPSLPHGESTFAGEAREQYEFGGFGVHAAAGAEIKLYRRLSTTIEYKLTFARPEIDIAEGTGQMTATSHHLAIGLAFALSR
jgi:hypothetical protein